MSRQSLPVPPAEALCGRQRLGRQRPRQLQRRALAANAAIALLLPVIAIAQTSAPKVSFEGYLHGAEVRVGDTARFAFEARLPSGYHVNSNAPLDEFLKPTRLDLALPDGVSVVETVYPAPLMFHTRFSETPLAVYEHQFVIGVQVRLPDDLPLGEHAVSATLRYQACSERVCYSPKTRKTGLVLRVVGRDAPVTPANEERFVGIKFSTP